MSGPASQYAAITAEVNELISRFAGNDKSRAAYMVARAALLRLRSTHGERYAAEKAFALVDELTGVQ